MTDLDAAKMLALVWNDHAPGVPTKVLASAFLHALSELDAARKVCEAADELARHPLFPRRDDETMGKADGSIWRQLNTMRDALTAYRARKEVDRGGS